MKESKLDNELERIYKKFPFLWENYNYHVKYFTRDYGMYYKGFIIGLENDVCKLVFEKETNSSVEPIAEYVGTNHSLFTPPSYSYLTKYGWYPLTGLIYWLTGTQCESDNDVDKDLELTSQCLKLYIDQIHELFSSPDELDSRLEYYRNLYKGNQITVEKIREERAKLQALGMDSSLEAAITSLRGGKNGQSRH